MSNLTPEQRETVSKWIEEGVGLSEIQKRLKEELGIALTYLESRLLMDDLKLQPKDPEEPAEPEKKEEEEVVPTPTGKVSVIMDQLTRPGSLISGQVVFSDGVKATWFLDQMGRLSLDPDVEGYRPSEKDVMEFQQELQRQASRSGL